MAACTCEIDPPRAVCKYCGQEIIWVMTRHGKKMPIDPGGHPTGNVLISEWGPDEKGEDTIWVDVIAWPPRDKSLISRCRHESHTYSCPVNGRKANRA